MTDIEFKIGQEYENRKGVYEVLALDKDVMSIRWENGEEVTTTADLQRRIIESMNHELASIRTKKSGRNKQPQALKTAIKFAGLKDDDFSKDVSGATWRHYDSLGGAVAVRLKSDKFDIASWPIFGLSAIHWADLDHRHHNASQLHPEFFARLDDSHLYFGLTVALPSQEKEVDDGKNPFTTWLTDTENDAWLNKVISKHNLSIHGTNGEQTFGGTVLSDGSKWLFSNDAGEEKEIESLTNFLDELTKSVQAELQITTTVKKEEVITRGTEIAEDIAKLFEVLMPVYEATAAALHQ